MTPEINPFQYAREINASNTKGYEAYLIDAGASWHAGNVMSCSHAVAYFCCFDES